MDVTAPAAPAVASDDYPADTWAGGAGVPGEFTLSAAGSADVTAYVYGLDVNPPTENTTHAARSRSWTFFPARSAPIVQCFTMKS